MDAFLRGARYALLLLLLPVPGAVNGADAAAPRLVSDVNRLTRPAVSVCGEPVPVNGFAYFCGPNDRLWITNGTAGGTRPIRLPDGTVPEAPAGSVIETHRAASAGGLYYFLWRGELWRTDGTSHGTRALFDKQGRALQAELMTDVDDRLLFFRFSSLNQGLELWRTDGTAAGTARIHVFAAQLFASDATTVGGELYFTIAGGTTQPAELWKSDGTATGTQPIRTIPAGNVGNLTDVHGALFFTAGGSNGPVELWQSNGTANGTVRLAPEVAARGQQVDGLTEVQGALYFTASSDGPSRAIWKSDGTPNGTRPFVTVPNIHGLTALGDVYLLSTTHDDALWRTDGTPEGTFELFDRLVPVGPPVRLHRGLAYFAGDDGSGLGVELWVTDGTRAGTRLVRDINWGRWSSNPFWAASIDAGLIFQANAGPQRGGPSLWITDGTPHATRQVRDLAPFTFDAHPSLGTVVSERLYFLANQSGGLWRPSWQLWRSDGTKVGTEPVLDPIPGVAEPGSSYRDEFAQVAGVGATAFVSARDASGWGLWRAGESGAEPLRNVVPVPPREPPSGLTAIRGALLFFSDTPTGRGLWRLDAAADTATLLVDGLVRPTALGSVGERFVFASNGDELWWSDGTAPGTRRIKSLEMGADARFEGFQRIGERFVFGVRSQFGRWGVWHRSALFTSNGKPGGTFPIVRPLPSWMHVLERGLVYTTGHDLRLSDGTSRGNQFLFFREPPGLFTPVGSHIYFVAGRSLWRTDGSTLDTVRVADGWDFITLAAVGDELYFTARGPQSRNPSLHKLDGRGGTVLVAPDLFVVHGLPDRGGLFLAGTSDDELQVWETDGTAAGTRPITAFQPPFGRASVATRGQEPWTFTLGDTLLLVANDGVHGSELWAFGPTDPTVQGRLGDYVWLDANENGVQDPNEQGLPGVAVHLERCSGERVRSTRSDAEGRYRFDGLAAGDYRLRFSAPFAHVFSPPVAAGDYRLDSNPDPATGTTDCIALGSPQRRLAIDAGLILQQRAQLGDRVWHDLDRDGVQEHGEPGFAHVEVRLETCDGRVLQSTATGSAGQFLFDWLVDGDYRLRFVAPDGYAFSPKNATGDFRSDSNAAPRTGLDSCRTVRAGQQRLSLDAGLVSPEP
ncbi:MAG TPA: SdrD B-like domain-containing protein [Pseudomonadales bacterium]